MRRRELIGQAGTAGPNAAAQSAPVPEVGNGSWPRAKTQTCCSAVEWRSQASDVRSFSREARLLPPIDAQGQKSRKLCGSQTFVARLATCVSCYYVSS